MANDPESASTDDPPEQLGDYRIVRKLGKGGMGTVYEAVQLGLDRRVALKVLAPRLLRDKVFLDRFRREARAAAALNHPNLVQVFDIGEQDGLPYYAMEFLEGENLGERMRRLGRLPLREALGFTLEVARALREALTQRIIHRDIKPENIMITARGLVKLADLGLAKILSDDSSMTMTGIGLGSPYYMAPEQAEDARRVDHRADIYALGISLLTLATGRRPFTGASPLALARAHLELTLPSGRQLGTRLPDVVEQMIQRMAAKNPEDRYPDYDQLIADLERVAAQIAALPPSPSAGGRADPAPAGTPPGTHFSTGPAGSSAPPASSTSGDEERGKLLTYGIIAATVVLIAYFVLDFAKHRLGRNAASGSPAPAVTSPPPAASPPAVHLFRSRPQQLVGLLYPDPKNARLYYLPMGPPAGPPPGPLFTGAGGKIPQAVQYAQDNPEDFRGILARFAEAYETAPAAWVRAEAGHQLDHWAGRLELTARRAITEHEARMKELLAAGKPAEAYAVWKEFPKALHVFRHEETIYQIIKTNIPPAHLPASFGPAAGPGQK